MFSRWVDQDISIHLTVPQYTVDLFGIIEENRGFLRKWLLWVSNVTAQETVRSFIDEQLMQFAKGVSIHAIIFYRGQMAGLIAYNLIDYDNNVGYIGYWLGESFTWQRYHDSMRQ